MANAHDTDSSSGIQTTSQDYSWSHTFSGSNRGLLVGVAIRPAGASVLSITCGGVALTQIRPQETNGNRVVEIWGLIAPATGTQTIEVILTGTAPTGSDAHAVSLTGIDQTSPFEASNGNNNAGSANPNVSLTTLSANAWIVDMLCTGTDDGVATPSGSQVLSSKTANTINHTGAMSYQGPVVTPGATSEGYTVTSSSWAMVAVAVKPATASSAPTVTTSAASSIGDNSATGNGNVTSDGGATVTERGFVWSTSANPTTSDNKVTVSGTTGSYTGGLTSLSAGTLYHYRSYAINSVGTSYGADTTFTTTNSGITAPTVSTQSASSLGQNSVVLNGNITAINGSNATERGFQFNTVASPDRSTYTDGSYGTGAFAITQTGLTAGQTYYYRSYATNSAGTSYGDWVSFSLLPATYNVSINGINRTADILANTLVIDDVLNDQQNTCALSLIDRSGNGIPSTDQEIIITLNDGTRLFGGYVLKVSEKKKGIGVVQADLQCVDYVRLLDSNLVNGSFTAQTDAQIIASILTTYCPGFGITGTNVISGVTISQMTFNYLQVSQCFRKIADLTGRNWYIDYNKDVHYFPLTQNPAPFNIDSSQTAYFDLNIKKDASQLKNRVYVRGGTKLSDPTTYSVKGDGVARKFPVPDKPHAVTLTVNGVAKTLGIKNVDAVGSNQWYLNFNEKYVEQDTSESLLATTDTLAITYTYDIPILVAVENTASIAASGQKEFAIFDKSISTTQAARDRASAELTDYALSIVEGGFKTYTAGFRSGQYININLSEYGVNANYLITKVTARSFGNGNYVYEISLASAKTMGIIRFLIELLEANKNLIELNPDEVVDNLLSITDSLNSDSLTDALTIDSAGPYSTWCTDSLQSTPTTRARWNLFQWR